LYTCDSIKETELVLLSIFGLTFSLSLQSWWSR